LLPPDRKLCGVLSAVFRFKSRRISEIFTGEISRTALFCSKLLFPLPFLSAFFFRRQGKW
jgi:hypothetical protein